MAAPSSLLSTKVDVTWRVEIGTVHEHRLQRAAALVRDRSPGAAREHDGVAAHTVVGRGDHRGLVAEAGREEAPGRPLLYATTPDFLERLGLDSLASLPSLAPLLGAPAPQGESA